MEELRKLEEFEATLSSGKDLFHSSHALLMYSIGKRSLKDLFRATLQHPECQNSCKAIAKNLCSSALSLTETLFQDGSCHEFTKIIEQARFFWELYQMRRVYNLLDMDDQCTLDEQLNKIIAMIHKAGIDEKSLSILPLEFLSFIYHDHAYPPRHECPVRELPYFLKDLSIVQPSGDKGAGEKSECSSRFGKQIDELLWSISCAKIDLSTLEDASKIRSDECLSCDEALKLSTRFLSVMDDVLTYPVNIVTSFFATFENFFYSVPENFKRFVMKQFYLEWILKHENLPSLEVYIENFSSDITLCVNGIGDHVQIQKDFSEFKKIRDKLSWYLLTVPRFTVRRLLLQCLDNKIVVPGVMNVLRYSCALFEIEVRSEKWPSRYTSVLLDCIALIFDEDAHRWDSLDQQDRLVYLLSSFCRIKRSDGKDKGTEGDTQQPLFVSETPILIANSVINLFVLPNLMKRSHEILMLRILCRFMQSVGLKEIHLEWSTSVGKKNDSALQAPELVILVVELLMEYERSNQEAADVCHSLLKTLGGKLQGDGVVFEPDTSQFILYSLRRHPWWVRYCVCAWFSRTLCAPSQQLPTGLYKSLALDQQEKCEQICVDYPFSPAECFFRSLFELALFDVDLATAFLKSGISVYPRDDNLVEKMAMALVDSCEAMPRKQRIADLAPIVSELLRIFDPSREVRFVDSLCESTLHGLRLIQHLFFFATAAKLAMFKNDNDTAPTIHGEETSKTKQVAIDILQAFCELAKAHADKEIIDLRRSRLLFPPDIKEDVLPPPQVTIRREERVYSQLSALFNIACSFTRLVDKPSSSLQVVINCLAELLLEVQSMRTNPCLDEMPSNYYKGNTVYVIAQPGASKSPEMQEGNRKKSQKCEAAGDTRSMDEMYCAENELFGTVVGDVSAVNALATARQIGVNRIRENVEKRLLSRGGEAVTQAPTDSSHPGKNARKKRNAKRR